MKFKTIRMRTLATVLPLVVVSMVTLTVVSYKSGKSIINKEIDTKMNNQLGQVVENIERNLEKHAAIPINLAKISQASGSELSKEQYGKFLENVITTNKDTLGAGVWYEPYKYNGNVKFFGPYAYKDKDKIVFTEDYATEDYNYPNQDWYKGAVNTKEAVVWSNPYYDETTKITMVTATSPFYDKDNKLLGTTTGDIDISNLQKMIGEIKVGEKGKAILIDNTGLFMAGVAQDKIMKQKISDDNATGLKALSADLLSGKSGNSEYSIDKDKNVIYYETIPSTKWVVALTIPEKELYAPLNSLLIKLGAIATGVIVLVGIAIFLFSTYISKNLKKADTLSEIISQGDLSQNIEVTSDDEIGHMYKNLNTMTFKLKEVLGSITLNLDTLVATSEELTASADQTQMASEKIAISMQELAEGSDEQFQSSNSAVKVVEDISLKMQSISVNIEEVTNTSLLAAKTANSGEAVITKVKDQITDIDKKVALSSDIVNNLGDKSTSIGDIVSIITSISEQTNLLALNAAIEAARAGEQGRGFAVVADEVRKLAEQSGNAAEQIASLITEIQSEIKNAISMMKDGTDSVREGIVIVDEAKKSFDNINGAVIQVSDKAQNVSELIIDIYGSTKNMVAAIEKISKISQDSTANTQNVAASAEEQSALMKEVALAAEGLSNMAVELQEHIAFFKV